MTDNNNPAARLADETVAKIRAVANSLEIPHIGRNSSHNSPHNSAGFSPGPGSLFGKVRKRSTRPPHMGARKMSEAKSPRARRPLIGEAIKERFADGKWHRPSLIAEMIRADEAHVLDTINGMSKNRTYGCKVERKRVGTHIEFRIGG